MKKSEPVIVVGSLQNHAAISHLNRGGYALVSEQRTSGCRKSLKCIVVGQIWKSQQNGMVYDPRGLSPTICVGHHSGVEPKIIEYEKD